MREAFAPHATRLRPSWPSAATGAASYSLTPTSTCCCSPRHPHAPSANPSPSSSGFCGISGLRVSQSVHTPAECCEIHDGNLELTISLLDQRYLCGDAGALRQARSKFSRSSSLPERDGIVLHLGAMTRGRHAKYGNTIYHLEPNVKEHPGGLRDIHVMHWLGSSAACEAPACTKRARVFCSICASGCTNIFSRDNNLLTFEAQDALARSIRRSSCAAITGTRARSTALSSGSLEAPRPAARSLFGQFRDWRSRLSNSEFTVSRERILLRNPSQLETDPAVDHAPDDLHGAPPDCPWRPIRKRGLQNASCIPAAPGPNCANCSPCRAAPMRCTRMADLNLLQKIIPEWAGIDCMVVRDFYHRYTVDEHTLVTLETAGESDHRCKDTRHDRFARLFSEIDQPEILRLALLLHDIGKGDGPGEHSTAFCRDRPPRPAAA